MAIRRGAPRSRSHRSGFERRSGSRRGRRGAPARRSGSRRGGPSRRDPSSGGQWRVVRDRARRDPGHRGGERLRQDSPRPGPRRSASRRRPPRGIDRVSRSGPAGRRRAGVETGSGTRHRDRLPGAGRGARPRAHHRISDRRGPAIFRARGPGARDAARALDAPFSRKSRFRIRIAGSPNMHTGSRADSASAPFWRSRSPEIRRCSSPTSRRASLDATGRRRGPGSHRSTAARPRSALILITHDLASAASRADRALVLYAGRIVESGSGGIRLPDSPPPVHARAARLASPSRPGPGARGPPLADRGGGAASRLPPLRCVRLRAPLPREIRAVHSRGAGPLPVPVPGPIRRRPREVLSLRRRLARRDDVSAASRQPGASRPLLSVDGLVRRYPRAGSSGGRLAAVDGVSFAVEPGKTLALVGESGSGKTTIARIVLRLEKPDSGRIVFDGVDWLALSGTALRRKRRDLQIVFQDPQTSLHPKMRVGDQIAEPLRVQGWRRGARCRREWRIFSPRWGSTPETPAGFRPNSPAGSASGSRSRAPWRRGRSFSFATSPSPRSTPRSRRRSSICSSGCGASSALVSPDLARSGRRRSPGGRRRRSLRGPGRGRRTVFRGRAPPPPSLHGGPGLCRSRARRAVRTDRSGRRAGIRNASRDRVPFRAPLPDRQVPLPGGIASDGRDGGGTARRLLLPGRARPFSRMTSKDPGWFMIRADPANPRSRL